MKLPQLSLRELFLLVALAAMGCGWLTHHWRTRTAIENQRAQLKELAEEYARALAVENAKSLQRPDEQPLQPAPPFTLTLPDSPVIDPHPENPIKRRLGSGAFF
jgi:hypothetical protein